MARGRMINRSVATSRKVADLDEVAGPWSLVFHHRIIAFLDKYGNCRADPYWLKAEVMPRVSGCSPEDCRKFAAALDRVGLAVMYESRGMPYLHFPGFRDEQVGLRVDRESAEVPVPQGFDESSGRLPEGCRKVAVQHPAEVEVEGEVEVEVNLSSKSAVPIADLWEIWIEELGGKKPHPRLTDTRKKKIRALWDEHLAKADDPVSLFRKTLRAIKASDHHMSVRSYQMPESTFRNEDRRDKWALLGKNGGDPSHWSEGLDG